MKHLIDKSALVAEIERRKTEAESNCGGYKSYDEHRCNACIVDFYEEFLEILDTIEVKEVDLEKELESWRHNHFHGRRDKEASGEYLERVSQLDLAKHFFELGLKAQKEE